MANEKKELIRIIFDMKSCYQSTIFIDRLVLSGNHLFGFSGEELVFKTWNKKIYKSIEEACKDLGIVIIPQTMI